MKLNLRNEAKGRNRLSETFANMSPNSLGCLTSVFCCLGIVLVDLVVPDSETKHLPIKPPKSLPNIQGVAHVRADNVLGVKQVYELTVHVEGKSGDKLSLTFLDRHSERGKTNFVPQFSRTTVLSSSEAILVFPLKPIDNLAWRDDAIRFDYTSGKSSTSETVSFGDLIPSRIPADVSSEPRPNFGASAK